ncbi:MAG: hypothetical protein ABL925_11725 [Methylococcales bacterium]
MDESDQLQPQCRRVPPQQLVGRVTEKGDVISSLLAEDWGKPSMPIPFIDKLQANL